MVGYAVHEIGHALAFYHEQSRHDRDAYIRVLTENILSDHFYNFVLYKPDKLDTYNVPYDLASVMHYNSKAFSVDKEIRPSLETLDPIYQRTMGQRQELSFFDKKAANLAYCNGSCTSGGLQCERGGYQDPNNCSQCACPDAFGGIFCQHVASSSNQVCNKAGQVNIHAQETSCVRLGPYTSGTSCTWLLKAQNGCRVKLWFTDEFNVWCSGVRTGPSCYHYVEVQFKGRLNQRGPRFCCSNLPSFESLISDYNEMAVIFRSTRDAGGRQFHGFTMCYSLADPSCLLKTKAQLTTTLSSSTAITTSTGRHVKDMESQSKTTAAVRHTHNAITTSPLKLPDVVPTTTYFHTTTTSTSIHFTESKTHRHMNITKRVNELHRAYSTRRPYTVRPIRRGITTRRTPLTGNSTNRRTTKRPQMYTVVPKRRATTRRPT